MGKMTKEEYLQVYRKRTELKAKQERLKRARLSKKRHEADLVVHERREGQDAACAFLVRKQKDTK